MTRIQMEIESLDALIAALRGFPGAGSDARLCYGTSSTNPYDNNTITFPLHGVPGRTCVDIGGGRVSYMWSSGQYRSDYPRRRLSTCAKSLRVAKKPPIFATSAFQGLLEYLMCSKPMYIGPVGTAKFASRYRWRRLYSRKSEKNNEQAGNSKTTQKADPFVVNDS